MKYSNYTKKELLEVIECLEHNYNTQRERADNQFEILTTLQEKLDIAVKALKYYADKSTWSICAKYFCSYVDGQVAEEALAKIKEIK